jgi:phosphatidate cytidylyltransferase
MREEWIGSQLLTGFLALFLLLCAFQLLSFAMRKQSSVSWQNFHERMKTWWLILTPLTLAIFLGPLALSGLWCLICTWAVYEMLGVAPLDSRDKPVKSYLIASPWLLALGQLLALPYLHTLFLLLLPAPLFLLIGGHTSSFLQRLAYIEWILFQIVAALGFGLLLILEAPGFTAQGGQASIFILVLCMTQLHDAMQYCVGKLFGKHPILPLISPKKTWEGLIGGLLITSLLGALAFSLSLLSFQEGFFLTALICFSGFWSDVMMSAIKRGLGIKDYGQTLKGHGGLLDRIDSLLLALPLAYISLHYLS